MTSTVRVACVQVNARDNMAANIEAASAGVRRAVEAGAALVSLPEYVSLMDGRGRVMRAGAFVETEHPALSAFRALARELAVTLHVGSLTIMNPSGRPTNRGYLVGPDGEVIAHYDKINMFDLVMPDGREAFESRVYDAGSQAVVTPTAIGPVGLTICYDLRFPELFRSLSDAGANIILAPAAFLPMTGIDHWHVLVRARAIDNGCFIVAAAMCGEHGGERASFGHSLIVDPWGRVLAEGGAEPDVIVADLDLAMIAKMRAQNPWLRPPERFTPPRSTTGSRSEGTSE